VAAINFFTGLSCEGYSMATRVEPFLPFVDQAVTSGGALSVRPTLSCVDARADGAYTAYFGYENDNLLSLDIPLGHDNQLLGEDSGVLPTRLAPGQHPWNFFVDFSPRTKVKYRLRNSAAPTNGNSQLVASASSTRCEASAPEVSCARACRAYDVCEIEGFPFAVCMSDCLGNLQFFEQNGFPQCAQPFAALQRCLAGVPSVDLCNFDDPPPICLAESEAYDACFVSE
jgi:hypothetical protein